MRTADMVMMMQAVDNGGLSGTAWLLVCRKEGWVWSRGVLGWVLVGSRVDSEIRRWIEDVRAASPVFLVRATLGAKRIKREARPNQEKLRQASWSARPEDRVRRTIRAWWKEGGWAKEEGGERKGRRREKCGLK